MAEDIEGVRQPAVFTQFKRYAVARTQRAGDMGRIAETMNDLRREPQVFADLMPHRHQLDGARIGEAERFTPAPNVPRRRCALSGEISGSPPYPSSRRRARSASASTAMCRFRPCRAR